VGKSVCKVCVCVQMYVCVVGAVCLCVCVVWQVCSSVCGKCVCVCVCVVEGGLSWAGPRGCVCVCRCGGPVWGVPVGVGRGVRV